MTPEEFNSRFFPHAQAVSARTGLDPRLVLAQAALETGYGKSAPNMNYFGIKSHGRAGGQTLQTSEFENGRMVSQPASFRAYESPEQSFQGYADFLLTNPRYKGVLAADGLENQIAAMAKSGYATDPNYGAKLASIAGVGGGGGAVRGGMGSDGLLGGAGNDSGGGPAMEADQGGLFGFLGDREQRARLGLALMGMSMHPNEGAMAMMRDTIAQAQAARENQFAQAETAKAENRTLEYIANLGTPQAQQALAYAQGTGDVAGALKMAMQTADPMDALAQEKLQLEIEAMKKPPAPDFPAAVDAYNFAVSQGYTGSFIEYEKEMAAANRAQTNINVGNNTKLSDKLDEGEAVMFGAYDMAGSTSASALGDLDLLEELSVMAPQGPIVGRLAGAFQGVSSAADAFKSIISRVTPSLRVEGSGATSDMEFKAMQDSLPALANSPEANRAIIGMLRAKAQINMERANIVRAFKNSDRSDAAARAAREALTELDSRSIMTPELRLVLSGLSGAPATGGGMSATGGAMPATGGVGGQPVVIDGVTIQRVK